MLALINLAMIIWATDLSPPIFDINTCSPPPFGSSDKTQGFGMLGEHYQVGPSPSLSPEPAFCLSTVVCFHPWCPWTMQQMLVYDWPVHLVWCFRPCPSCSMFQDFHFVWVNNNWLSWWPSPLLCTKSRECLLTNFRDMMSIFLGINLGRNLLAIMYVSAKQIVLWDHSF